MKKSFKISLIGSTIISIGIVLINYVCAIFFKKIPFSTSYYGGEIYGSKGIGVRIDTIVPLTTIDDPNKSITNISLDFKSFIIFFIIMFILIFIISLIVRKIKKLDN